MVKNKFRTIDTVSYTCAYLEGWMCLNGEELVQKNRYSLLHMCIP